MKYKIEYLDPASLLDYENNAKKHPEAQIAKLAKEIESVGFRQPIVVDHAGVICSGHGRKLAAIRVGLKEVPVHRLPSDIAPERVRAMRLFDNKIADTDLDKKMLAKEIAELAAFE